MTDLIDESEAIIEGADGEWRVFEDGDEVVIQEPTYPISIVLQRPKAFGGDDDELTVSVAVWCEDDDLEEGGFMGYIGQPYGESGHRDEVLDTAENWVEGVRAGEFDDYAVSVDLREV